MIYFTFSEYTNWFYHMNLQARKESKLPNMYHKAMFFWSFQRGLEGFRFDLGDQLVMAQQSSSPAQFVQRYRIQYSSISFNRALWELIFCSAVNMKKCCQLFFFCHNKIIYVYSLVY
jgi:hypothetical protein